MSHPDELVPIAGPPPRRLAASTAVRPRTRRPYSSRRDADGAAGARSAPAPTPPSNQPGAGRDIKGTALGWFALAASLPIASLLLMVALVAFTPVPRRAVASAAGAGVVVSAAAAVAVARGVRRRLAALERERDGLARDLVRASRAAALGEIASSIAHDLNNPLAVMNEEVGWLSDLLATSSISPEPTRQEFANSLGQIGTQIRRAAGFTRRVLDWARDAEGGAVTGDVNALLVDTLYLLEGDLAGAGVRVVQELAPGLPAVAGNPKDLGQVFLHLMKNALDAMRGGSGTLHISTGQAGGTVRVAIADTGTGIPPELLGRIFEPFFTTKPEGAGTGLGLRISALIARRAGGRIEVESSPGQGAVFRVVLPAAAAPAAPDRGGTHAGDSAAAGR